MIENNNVSSNKSKSIKKSRKNKTVQISTKSKSWNLFKFKNFIKV